MKGDFIEMCECIADTDIEADVEPSIETEERLRSEAEQARLRQEELDRIAADVLAKRQAVELEQQRRAEESERVRQVRLSYCKLKSCFHGLLKTPRVFKLSSLETCDAASSLTLNQ